MVSEYVRYCQTEHMGAAGDLLARATTMFARELRFVARPLTTLPLAIRIEAS
jgi:hypothetical protein